MKKIILGGFFLIVAVCVVPWNKFGRNDNVTVYGEAKTTVKNQVASFYAGVSVSDDNKQSAIDEVNNSMTNLIKAVKDFGIDDKDIKTQSVGVYEDKMSRIGQWTVSNAVEITLRNVDRSAELVNLLNKSKANNVSGPSFRVDDTSGAEKSLYEMAIKDAKDKATLIAKASGRTLGKVMLVVDGGGVNNIYPMMAKAEGDLGAPVELGSATVSKSMTVTFELR